MKITTRDLTVFYGEIPAIRSVDLMINSGELVTLLGPNGSGKSTLLKCMGRALTPDRGTVFLNEQNVAHLSARKLATIIAAVEQEVQVAFDFTVREVVEMGRFPYLGRGESAGTRDKQAIQYALETTGIAALGSRNIHDLSGGEKQRVFLALALAQEPRVLLLDEPTSGLDIHYRLKIMDTVQQLSATGITVITAIHDLNLAANYSDRVVLLSGGTVVNVGGPEQVLTRENILKVFGVDVTIEISRSNGKMHISPV